MARNIEALLTFGNEPDVDSNAVTSEALVFVLVSLDSHRKFCTNNELDIVTAKRSGAEDLMQGIDLPNESELGAFFEELPLVSPYLGNVVGYIAVFVCRMNKVHARALPKKNAAHIVTVSCPESLFWSSQAFDDRQRACAAFVASRTAEAMFRRRYRMRKRR
ncbi:hypothetical protein MRX96_012129 [Rhipicephalus microplus]